MALPPGTRLGVYEVTAPLGEGGMGQVWRATDTTLGRQVAIKVLPDAFAADPERLARFEREAKTLASLNHPHIAAIYGFEKSGNAHALVMELVEGEDLSRRIARGALPLEEALPIAKQIAEALEAAHALGIIHRDLKPANIKIRDDGTVKVLDFGLAKALDPNAASGTPDHSPTITTPAMTQAGMILGTAAYMSPEQARGKTVDKRSDIWAFGAVLYEMLSGARPFDGEDSTEVIAAVVKTTPNWSALPADVPRPLVTLIQRCLEKDRKTRVADIAVARFLLADATMLATPDASLPVHAPVKTPRLWMAATAALTALAAFALWGWLTPAPPEPRPLTHFTTAAPQGIGANPIAVSRDGSHLAFTNTARNQIYIRSMDDPVAKPVPGTQDGNMPAFSPDGQSLAFIAGVAPPFQLKKVPIAGGAPLTLMGDIAAAPPPMTWGDDGNILLGGPELRRVSEAGGKPVTIAKADTAGGDLLLATPQLLPGGKHILATVVTIKGFATFRVVTVDAATGNMKVLLDGVGETRFVPTGRAPGAGHLVYSLNGSLFAATFDAATLQVGPAAPVLEGLRNQGGLTHIGFSRSGTLAYPGREGANSFSVLQSTLMWVDRQGAEQPLTEPSRIYSSPRISPDGGRVAFAVTNLAQSFDVQVWVHDLARGTTTRLTFERSNVNPVWTADGKRVVYLSAGSITSPIGTLTSVAADGSGQPVTLTDDVPLPIPTSVSPDGKLVIGVRGNLAGDRNAIWVLPLDGGAKPQPFLDNRFTRGNLQFSPDGKWMAYESNETGRNEVYVVPFPGPGGKTQVSTDGGTQPRWNRNGRELFFRNGARMMAVDVETGAVFRAGTARALFEKASSDYDVAPDGKRFLMLKPNAAATESGEVHVILNWFDDLRRRVPLGR